MDRVAEEYANRYDSTLVPLATALEHYFKTILAGEPRIDRISARAKSIEKFAVKASKTKDGILKYTAPFQEIQDQVGARIIAFYLPDVERVCGIVKSYFNFIEMKSIEPESASEFGYVGHHFILPTPSDILDSNMNREHVPEFFELQIKTLFQHAWSEAEHDLGYKPDAPLSHSQKRSLAFTAAQSWGADEVFERLFTQQQTKTATPDVHLNA